MFTKTVKEAPVRGTAVEITGLDPGDYFWNVTATDGKKPGSVKSAKFQVYSGGARQVSIDAAGD